MAEASFEKKIKVMIAASGRIKKEYIAYKVETEQIQNTLNHIEDIEENALKIKHQTELLNESKSMLPNAFARLEENNQRLSELLAQYAPNEDLFKEAQNCIQNTTDFLNEINPAI